jgi:hypothetical protein
MPQASVPLPQKPLRADDPVKQIGKLDPAVQRGRRVNGETRVAGDGFGEESPRESRPACARILPFAASAQLVNDSVVGPPRRAPSNVGCGSGRRREVQSKADGVGRVPQRGAGGRAPEDAVADRGRRECPSSASGSPRRAGVSGVRRGRPSARASAATGAANR